ncbi:MAG TPA: hypothetical protein VLG92_00760 [Candidatus Saccharimonadia bacterium]|nr:hypothetical protein [Candidatus Saccharimonadia bacterium]
MDSTQPGQVIMPNLPEEPKPAGDGAPGPERPTEQPGTEPTPAPISVAAPTESPISVPLQPQADAGAGWSFHEEDSTGRSQAELDNLPQALTWTASEFIDHEKSTAWYTLLALSGLAVAAGVYFIMKDILSTAVILFATLAFGAFAARKPRVQQYALTTRGLQIGAKLYDFQDYKNFSVTPEGAVTSIVFMPLKRFMAPLTVYVMSDMERQVVDFLGGILPFEPRRFDAIDGLLRQIHF